MANSWARRNACFLAGAFLCPFAYIVPPCLARTHHNPPVGVYIGLMGLTAAIMSLFRLNRWAKSAWIIFMTLLVVAEIKNLYVADAEQVAKFDKISKSLDQTNRGLTAAASSIDASTALLKGSISDNQKEFKITLKQNSKVLGLSTRNLEQVTGGDSFAFMVPQPPLGDSVPLAAHNNGHAILSGVDVEIMRTADFPCDDKDRYYPVQTKKNIGTLPAASIRATDLLISPTLIKSCHEPSEPQIDIYQIEISAQNGAVVEVLQFKPSPKTRWAMRYSVYKNEFITKGGRTSVTVRVLIPLTEWEDLALPERGGIKLKN